MVRLQKSTRGLAGSGMIPPEEARQQGVAMDDRTQPPSQSSMRIIVDSAC